MPHRPPRLELSRRLCTARFDERGCRIHLELLVAHERASLHGHQAEAHDDQHCASDEGSFAHIATRGVASRRSCDGELAPCQWPSYTHTHFSGRWPMLSPEAVSGDYACPA
eukprot:4950292-Prymnesium_polylepis.1